MPRTTIAVLAVQKGLAISHHETAGRVHHPGNPDGIYGRWTAASLRTWMRVDPYARQAGLTDFNVAEVSDADGRVRHIVLDSSAAALLAAAGSEYNAARHRRPIATVTSPAPTADPVPVPAAPPSSNWWSDGANDPPPGPVRPPPAAVIDPPIPPIPGFPQPSPAPPLHPAGPLLPTLRRRSEPPLWPWIAGSYALNARS